MKNFNVFVLDGDNLRLGLNKGLKFSPEDRTENIRRTEQTQERQGNPETLQGIP